MEQQLCIHRYLTKCKTNPQPPGFADFIRGTITLYLLSKRYNYKLLIDYNSHPLFKNLEFNEEYFIMDTKICDTLEFLPPKSYQNIYNDIETLFKHNNHIIYIHTNSFYSNHGICSNFTTDEINDAKKFIINLIKPNPELLKYYNDKFNDVLTNEYIVIHIRFHDNCFFDNNFDIPNNKIKNIVDFINNLSIQNNQQIIIISNWKKYINNNTFTHKNIYVSDSKPMHTGSLTRKIINSDDIELIDYLKDTLNDLLLLTNSKKNYCISQYGGSGFSELFSNIYNIPYIKVSKILS
jgi:hypothetical protein